MKMFCCRVWYTDGTAVLIDAYSQEEAARRATKVDPLVALGHE